MKCQQVQKRLMAMHGSGPMLTNLRQHVDGCEPCQVWVKRITAIENAIDQIAVPDSSAARNALIDRFLNEPVTVETGWRVGGVRLNWVRIVCAIAAVLIVGLAVSGVFNREPNIKPTASEHDALLAKMVERHTELATAGTETKRIEVLAEMAEELDRETRSVAYVAGADDMDSLAELYVSLVGGPKGVVARVDDLGRADKQKVIKELAERLRKSGDAAERLARDVPPPAVAAIKRIAETAREAHKKLSGEARALTQDAPPPTGAGRS